MFQDTEKLLKGKGAEIRKDALEILGEGIRAVDPYTSMKDFLELEDGVLKVEDSEYRLDELDRVIVLGAGKAAIPMVTAVVDLLGDRAEGHVNALEDRMVGRVTCSRATHPIPGPEGVEGSRRIMELASSAGERDLVLCLISGGGSALLPLPEEGITLEDKMGVTDALLKCGATIQELNCVRKHISAIKGGKLARAAAPARVVSLILSDVIGDPLDSIASGPTAPDSTTYEDARRILHHYEVWGDVSEAVRHELEQERFETPKEGDPVFDRVHNVLVGNNRKAQRAMAEHARNMGYKCYELEDYLLGNAREAGPRFIREARAMVGSATKAAVVGGGETTVVVKGEGRGGRNQEMALVVMDIIEKGELFASVGTDGIDGKSHAAGALVDKKVDETATMYGLNAGAYLMDNDSTTFFEKAGGLLVTGPTGTNVADVQLYLVLRG